MGVSSVNYYSECGQQVDKTMKFCSNCGHSLANVEIIQEETKLDREYTKTSTIQIDRAEPTYYSDEKGVRITPTRLIIPSRLRDEGPSTYSMANITSVKTEKRNSNPFFAILIALLGIALIIVGYTSDPSLTGIIIAGAVLAVAGLAWAILSKPTYHLRISSASGETDALESKDKESVDRVVIAINEALIKRG